jgi:hypothetical protein
LIVLPKIQPFIFGDEPAYIKDSANVQCGLSSGDTPVVFSWMLNEKPVEEIDGITVGNFGKKMSVLSIESLSENHAGNITCLASNRAGISSYTAQLVIKGIFYFTYS